MNGTTAVMTRVAAAALLACGATTTAQAFTFETEGGVRGNFDSTITTGIGVRGQNPSCKLVGDPSYCDAADVFGRLEQAEALLAAIRDGE